MAEIEYNGVKYHLATIDAMVQLHIARRLMPIMGQIGGEQGMSGLFQAIGKMEDADFEYIVGKCLSECRRVNGETTAKIYVSGRLMFEDIGAVGMTKLTVETIRENMADFFTGLLSGSLLPQG